MKVYRVLSILLLSLLSIGVLNAQVKQYKPIEELKWRGLTGKVYFVPFFIDTPDGEFEEDEREYLLGEVEGSKEWMLLQSYEYPDVELEIITDYFTSHEEEIYIPDVHNWNKGNNRNVGKKIAQYIGFDDMEGYMEFNHIDLEECKVVILCFVKKYGRSHAYDFNGSVFSENISIDHAIIFSNFHFKMYTGKNVITHEVLHLFRAWDLYGGEPQDPIKAEKLKELYPNSIMLSTHGRKPKTLDELNAWRIGWNMNPKPFFVDYKPEYRKNMANKKKKTKIKFDLSKKQE